MKVFLGGTCSGYNWRRKLIPMLHCDYYNPIVKNWSESDRQREVHEREICDYVLYVITSGMRGVYSIAEIIDDSNKRPEATIVCVLYDGFEKSLSHSLQAVVRLAQSNGATVCESLSEVAQLLNSAAANPDDGTEYEYSVLADVNCDVEIFIKHAANFEDAKEKTLTALENLFMSDDIDSTWGYNIQISGMMVHCRLAENAAGQTHIFK